ncbi:MAG TPA: T9SS type A sorting domain-containing protein, partial [Flavobacterium sp.]|uniref:T9SS type A sorting domain-containing protein n=1 Tax=Flavobacterium sp. TaxID=239 RepID=UPI002F40A0DC
IFIIDRTAPVIDCNNGDPIASDDSGTVYLYQNGTTYTAMDASGNTSRITCEENESGKNTPIKQLEQINTDSKTNVAPTAAKIEFAGFEAHPVPFKDQLTIKYKFDYKSDVKIEVFNAQGISVLSKEDTNGYFDKEISLDLKSNRGGEQVYIVKVTTDRGSSTKKVLSSK